MINKENMEKWIQALESDKHQQCRGTLRQAAQEHGYVVTFSATGSVQIFGPTPEMHCALGIGVLVALQHGVEECDNEGRWVWDWSDLAPPVRQFYGLESSDPKITIDGHRTNIINHNDDRGHSFWTIAQAMRAEFLKDNGDG